MLQITIVGRLTKDAEKKVSKKGNDYVAFDVAVNKGYGNNQETVFVSCKSTVPSLISPLSKAKKGCLICVTGELSVSTYQKKDGTGTIVPTISCFVSSFSYIPIRNEQEQQNQTQQQNSQPQQQTYNQQNGQPPQSSPYPANYGEYTVPDDGDLPF